jgi:integrase
MSTIRKRGAKWQVQVRVKGSPSASRSFFSKQDAQKWARQIEAEADRRGLPADRSLLDTLTLKDLLIRYRDSVVTSKRGSEIETIIINAFLRYPSARLPLSRITPAHFAEYRDHRLQKVKASTLLRELGIISHAFETARRDWALPIIANPVRAITKPATDVGRTRRLAACEYEEIKLASRRCRNRLIPVLVDFALETGMRQGELLSAKWSDLNIETRLLHIPITKNGHARTIPLSKAAIALLVDHRSKQTPSTNLIFPLSARSVKLAWKRLTKRAKIENLHFHDLRHEAISRFFERGLSIPEVALISGHRDMRTLFRYTHLKAEDVVRKLG